MEENNQIMEELNLIEKNKDQKMKLTKNQVSEKYGKQCMHCMPNKFLPYEYGWSCAACGSNTGKWKNELTKIHGKNNY